MSKLNDLLSTLISKVNASVKTEAQTFTDEQKAQARANIGAGTSNVESFNDLKDLPFGKSDTLTWDGNTEGLVSVDLTEGMGMPEGDYFIFYKVSDSVPTEADCENANNKGYITQVIDGIETPQDIWLGYDGEIVFNGTFMFIPYDNLNLFDIVIVPEKGVYFAIVKDGESIVRHTSLTIPNYNFVKTLDAEYLPSYDEIPIDKKPFGEGVEDLGDTITWDGNAEGKVSVDFSQMYGFYYKVSDSVPTKQDFLRGGFIGALDNGEPVSEQITSEDVDTVFDTDGFAFLIYMTIIPYDNYDWDGLIFPEKGVYFLKMDASNYTTFLTLNGYNFTNTELKTINPKYLPEHLQFGESETGGDTLTWDGDTEGLVSGDFSTGKFAKLSDSVPTKEDCVNGASMELSSTEFGVGDTIQVDGENTQSVFQDDGFAFLDYIVIVPVDNYEYDGLTFPKKGTYGCGYQLSEDNYSYCSKFTINGYTGFPSVKTLDNKYLPKAEAIADLTEAPTMEDFNNLLAVLRNAGYLKF